MGLFKVIVVVLLVQLGFTATVSRFVSLNAHLNGQERYYVEGDPKVTHKVVFQIVQKNDKQGIEEIGELHLGLFGEIVPKTVNNFLQLSSLSHGFGYKNTQFHRIVKNFMIQAGSIDDSKGRLSIYNDYGTFDDENFELLHDRLGRLSMANLGPNTNGGQFFITTDGNLPHLDGKHVVFGQLIGGFNTLATLNQVKTEDSQPVLPIIISDIQIFDLFPISETIEEIDSPSSFYSTFFVILLLLALALLYKNWYYKRQAIVDIKDNNFY